MFHGYSVSRDKSCAGKISMHLLLDNLKDNLLKNVIMLLLSFFLYTFAFNFIKQGYGISENSDRRCLDNASESVQ